MRRHRNHFVWRTAVSGLRVHFVCEQPRKELTAGNEELCDLKIPERGDLYTLVINEIYSMIITALMIISSCYVTWGTYCDERLK